MVAPENPFLTIVPEDYGDIINREEVIKELEQKTMEALDGGTLILFSAGYGMGKSVLTDIFKKKVKKKVKIVEIDFTNFIADDIRNLPFEKRKDILVIVERFDLVDGITGFRRFLGVEDQHRRPPDLIESHLPVRPDGGQCRGRHFIACDLVFNRFG